MTKKDYEVLAGFMINLFGDRQLPYIQWRLVLKHIVKTLSGTYGSFDEDEFRSYIESIISTALRGLDNEQN